MDDCTICNVCSHPAGNLENAAEQKQINSNVRRFNDEKFTVWRCSNCLSLHSKETVDLEYYYANYPIKKHAMKYGTRCAYRNRIRMLLRYGLNRDADIMDFGCGPGLFVSFLNQHGYNVAGYDAFVDKYSNKKVLEKSYDIVTSYDVIEHDNNPGDLFCQLAGRLKRKGLLIVGTPRADKIDLSNHENFSMELHQPYHRHILSEKALLSLGKLADLEVVSVSRRFYFDTLYPMVNTRFIMGYIRRSGNVIDAAFEGARPALLLTSPLLILHGLFGYFYPNAAYMTVIFRNRG